MSSHRAWINRYQQRIVWRAEIEGQAVHETPASRIEFSQGFIAAIAVDIGASIHVQPILRESHFEFA